MNTPRIISRDTNNNTYDRAATTYQHSAKSAIDGHSGMEVFLFKSDNCEDQGGYVVRITGEDPWLIPYAVNIDGGVDIHIAGDCEGIQAFNALKAALSVI